MNESTLTIPTIIFRHDLVPIIESNIFFFAKTDSSVQTAISVGVQQL